jgi:hypothetical protein
LAIRRAVRTGLTLLVIALLVIVLDVVDRRLRPLVTVVHMPSSALTTPSSTPGCASSSPSTSCGWFLAHSGGLKDEELLEEGRRQGKGFKREVGVTAGVIADRIRANTPTIQKREFGPSLPGASLSVLLQRENFGVRTMTTLATNLPNEILEVIFEMAEFDGQRLQKNTFLRLAMVCKAWHVCAPM